MEDEIGIRISHERIYQHIYKDRLTGANLYTHLSHGRKKRRKRYNPGERTGNRGTISRIDARSALVDARLTQDHWEIDTIISKGQKGAAAHDR
jgi:IS30 family transposase